MRVTGVHRGSAGTLLAFPDARLTFASQPFPLLAVGQETGRDGRVLPGCREAAARQEGLFIAPLDASGCSTGVKWPEKSVDSGAGNQAQARERESMLLLSTDLPADSPMHNSCSQSP